MTSCLGSRRPRVAAVAVAALVGLGACSDQPVEPHGLQPEPMRASVSGSLFTDNDVVRGLLFMHGPVADAVPYVRDHLRLANHVDWFDIPDVERVQNDVMARLQMQDPSFIPWFAAEARSGDPVRIEQALRVGGDRVVSALEALPDYQTASREMQARQWEVEPLLAEQRALYPVDSSSDSQISTYLYEGSTSGGGGGGGGSGCKYCVVEPEMQMMHAEQDAVAHPGLEAPLEPDAALLACSPTVCVAGVFLALGWTAAAAVNYVGGVNVALAVNVYLWVNVRNSLRRAVAMDGLGREQFVASIAQTL